MKQTLFAILFLLCAGVHFAQEKQTEEKWKLVWSDEFDGEEIDRDNWDYDLGNGFYNYDANVWIAGWGNGELEYYTKEPENARVEEGILRIRALKESRDGFGYTSARMKTRKRDGTVLMATKYGKVEIRAKLPTGQGVWPALWMLPVDEPYGGWAASGEIDIVEARGQEPQKILGTLHYGSRWPENASSSREFKFPEGESFEEFHVYTLEWEPGLIRWGVDDKIYATQDFWWSSSKTNGANGAKPTSERDLNPWPAPFDRDFFLVMNVAVGGQFVGAPAKTTKFPAEMCVDYVRIYNREKASDKTHPRGMGKLPY